MRIFILTLSLLAVFLLSACGGSNGSNTKKDVASCEKQDDFVSDYPEKIVCTTTDGQVVELNLLNMFAGWDVAYFLEFSSIAFFDLTPDEDSNTYLVSVRGCTADHRCAILYRPGNKILTYTKELTY